MAFSRAAASLVVAATLAACGGKSGAGPAPATIERDELPNALATSYCEGLAACCQSVDQVVDVEACRAAMLVRLSPPSSSTTIRYDAVVGAQCADEVKSQMASCYAPENVTACEQMYVGLVPRGGACKNDGECAPSATGDVVSCSNSVCVEQPAQPRGVLGQGCSTTCWKDSSGTQCVAEAPIDPSVSLGSAGCYLEDGLYCEMHLGTCYPRANLDEDCSARYGCADDAWCNLIIGVCVARPAAGAPCGSPSVCLPTTYCDADGICQQKKADGESCSLGDECLGYCRRASGASTGSCASGPTKFVPTATLCQDYTAG